ncbi:MAG: MlaC/ttg2D family ABC transporter substrate-binding protein [Burkholderiaceae bacterium]
MLSVQSMFQPMFQSARRTLLRGGVALAAASFAGAVMAQSAPTAPDALIKSLGDEVLAAIKADKDIQGGDLRKINGLVETKILPHVDFARMTSLAVGRSWRSATPEQQKALQQEFRGLLIRTYAGALGAAKDATIQMRPLRAAADDTDLIVRSQVVQPRADPIQLDYRMEKGPYGWKIYDINVIGVWLVETYKGSFAQEIDKNGIDGLIKTLAEKNKSLESAAKKS